MILPPPRSPLFPYTTLFRSKNFPPPVALNAGALSIICPAGPDRCLTFEQYVSGVSAGIGNFWTRSEEHTSELQSHSDLVCRLLLEKKKDRLNTSGAWRRNRD